MTKILASTLSIAFACAFTTAKAETCDEHAFLSAERGVKTGTIKGSDRAYFATLPLECKADSNCGDNQISPITQGSYLVAGDKVLIAQDTPSSSCTAYYSRKGWRYGWIASSQLTAGTVSMRNMPRLAGRWKRGDDYLTISQRSKSFSVNGRSYWPGKNPVGQPPHIAAISASLAPSAEGTWTANERQCALTIKQVGSYLIAQDNKSCGAPNTSFDGIYVRQ